VGVDGEIILIALHISLGILRIKHIRWREKSNHFYVNAGSEARESASELVAARP